MRHHSFAILLLVFAMTIMGLAASAQAFSIEEIRFGVHGDKNRMVIEMSEKRDFRTFMLASPYRMVVDLPTFAWNIQGAPIEEDAGISNIRKGALASGISRIVFDLNGPKSIKTAFILPGTANSNQRLVIDFTAVSESTFAKTRGTVFGDLTEAGAPQPAAQAGNTLRFQNTAPQNSRTITPPSRPVKQAKPLVILDPGHGGQDPGAVGANGVHEKVVALAIAKELQKQLERSGDYRVKMTRSTDVFIRLRDRVRFARKHEADLFVSIHADSINKKGVRGASVYTLSEKASDRQTAALAARENLSDAIAGFDIEVEDDEVSNILVDLAMRDTMNQSKFVANTFVDEFRSEDVRLLENPHRSAGFAVLKAADIPSILVETGFMSNKREANLLTKDSHRRKLAGALKKGIDSYFAKVALNQQ